LIDNQGHDIRRNDQFRQEKLALLELLAHHVGRRTHCLLDNLGRFLSAVHGRLQHLQNVILLAVNDGLFDLFNYLPIHLQTLQFIMDAPKYPSLTAFRTALSLPPGP